MERKRQETRNLTFNNKCQLVLSVGTEIDKGNRNAKYFYCTFLFKLLYSYIIFFLSAHSLIECEGFLNRST